MQDDSGRSLTVLRVALMAVFGIDGAIFASWAARLPQVQSAIGGTGDLGLALLGIAVGALPAMVVTGRICRRLRPLRVACVTLAGFCVMVTVPGLMNSPLTLFAVLVVFGACYGATDVAMNTAAVDLATRSNRPIVPAFHGAFSLGSLVGAGVGALAAGAGISVPGHLAITGATGLVIVVLATWRAFGAAPRPAESAARAEPARGLGSAARRAIALGAILTGAAALSEGAVATWSGIHLVSVAGAALWVAPLGYGVLSLTETAARLAGPRLIERFGVRVVGVTGAGLGAAAFAVALVPSSVPALLGYALAGAGLANLFPLGIARSGAAGGSVGVSTASMIGYGGFLFGPPLIGVMAEAIGLTAALVLPIVVLAGAGVASLRLPAKSASAP